MAQWAKIKFFWETMLGSTGSTLAATSTATGDYSVSYLYNMLEGSFWKAANTTSPQYITYDAGAGNTKTADYLAIIGHNLYTAGAKITLQYSTDNFAADVNDAFTGFDVTADTVILKEFTAPAAKRYWRLKIEKSGGGSFSAAPYMAICIWGSKTELDWATASFDPHGQKAKSTVNKSYGGVVAGCHTDYIERSMSLRFDDADTTLYNKIKTWWETHGQKNLFVAYDTTNDPTAVWLMYPGEEFKNPVTKGTFRDIKIELTGRKE